MPGLKVCAKLRHKHGFGAISLMPTNIYGQGGSYHRADCYVLPALIRRFHEAAEAQAPRLTCWGTGTALRDFLHVDYLGEACVFALEHWRQGPAELHHLNVGTCVDLSITALDQAVPAATDNSSAINWNASQLDGAPQKRLDVSRLAKLGWGGRIPFADRLVSSVAEIRAHGDQHLVRR